MNDIRRSILWVVFGLSMVLIWDKWQIHNGQQPTFFPGSATVAAPAAAPAPSVDASLPTAVAAPAGTATANAVPGEAPAGAPSPVAARHEVTTDVFKLVFNTEGGSLIGAELLKHAEATQQSKDQSELPFTLLTQNADRIYVAQTGLIGGAFPTHKTPMTLLTPETALADGQNELQVRFESADVGGVKLVKTYTLTRGRYDIAVKHEVQNLGTQAVSPQLYVQLVRDGSKLSSETPFYSTFTGPAVYTDEKKYQKVEFADIEKNKAEFTKTASDGYVAMVQHYFASAWVLDAGVARDNFVRKVDNNLFAAGSITSLAAIEPGQTQTVQARLFVGPQEEKVLETIAPGLELVKDYGWLTILAKPLYWLLEKIHGFVANWGWSIVLLVVLIKAAFYWLNASAYRSMAKMKKINPRIMEMRERLKGNPQAMQQEMMKMYREEKVNPLGGCFPILIQIPVFIALYWVLLSSVEMRNAPWLAWITDLSSPDPFYILPLVMAVTTMIQTALNPLPPDPLQAKLMWLMPLMFSVMFFFFPSGLVLYWITNNVLTILQQAFINQKMGVPLKFSMPDFKK
ncbi:MAG: membrane protein insertase YidC [Hydrogenophaga sp.]|jgi:YidC/Oxa1 family membrane protein insertase|uniref:membrane protein insertase YidC n=1 Tax=Hydrogenophaga sp. TaxID=1904254 RepID=UPI0025C22EFD|nr:membrane protein insertase YidC [Hydrogenophaga sp.]MDO9131452.1 membrane protein insertase YidC [Hydrogenophaga sp.]MDO9507571.1 membrane protein insertase YidC [Hydrogenophaga sp.]MDP1783270.1 membrane protein insertase YidC [Hydrogenophaga sp.]MDP3628019.1 membrane protein insertase YidC [Hydrogenophaga sp.]MDZ4124909.1 membrane protein insertase YidC [Hydrogenophaga sp.]